MIERFVNYLVAREVVAPEQAGVQIFAMTALVETVAAHGVLFVLAAIFGVLPETVLFELVFMPLRSYAGGYHATSTASCFVMSTAVWGAVMALGQMLLGVLCLPILAVAAIMVWVLAPVPHKNNPVGPKRFARVKVLSRRFLAMDVVALVLCFAFGRTTWAMTGALTLLATSCSLLAAKKLE